MESMINNGSDLLDQAYAQVLNGKIGLGMNFLALGLKSLRGGLSPASWEQFIQTEALPFF